MTVGLVIKIIFVIGVLICTGLATVVIFSNRDD